MTPDEARKWLSETKTAYQTAFGSPGGKAVLDDLKPFCRARETCVVPGERDKTMVLEGRREVYLRIQDFLELTVDELFVRYTRPAQGAISHARPDPNPDSHPDTDPHAAAG